MAMLKSRYVNLNPKTCDYSRVEAVGLKAFEVMDVTFQTISQVNAETIIALV